MAHKLLKICQSAKHFGQQEKEDQCVLASTRCTMQLIVAGNGGGRVSYTFYGAPHSRLQNTQNTYNWYNTLHGQEVKVSPKLFSILVGLLQKIL